MTTTGRFPVFARAAAKMCSRLGVRFAEIQALETSESAMRERSRLRVCPLGGLFNWHRPAAIDQTCDKARAETVVDVDDGHIRGTGIQHT